MLVSRQIDTESSHWSFNKFETSYQKPSASSPRMSNHFDTPLSTQPEWQGQYSYLPPSESNIFSQYDSGNDNPEAAQPRSAAPPNPNPLEISVKEEQHSSPTGHRIDPLGLRTAKQPSPIAEHPEPQPHQYSQKATDHGHSESAPPTENQSLPLPHDPVSSAANNAGGPPSELPPPHAGNPEVPGVKEEDDDVVGDEEMVEDGPEVDGPGQPQTAAERTAQRRKMKRFRLTHQQTRFLMSEFAKQPHPDAAHRERLSREIPGLSPRQVQVWFQNRRAKIKRLSNDDRERMIRMRAVPDDFDNVSALHNPYGAMPLQGTPISSPVDFSPHSYADPMIRGPLMVDVRRAEGEEHISPTGLSPAFGNIGFNTSGDILSPLSPTSNDRYGYGSHMSGSLSAGPRSSSFGRHGSLDTSMQMQNRQGVRPLQPLQLRETMSRSRSDNLQSPLRSSMSWKGDSIDYSSYQGSHNNQTRSSYAQDQMGITTTTMGYDSTTYATSAVQSPTAMSYSSMQNSSTLQNPQNPNSRLRAASATLPLGLDLRNQYRSVGSALQSPGQSNTPRAGSSQYGGSTYSSSFPSAPLTAPVDFSLPRTGSSMRTAVTDYSMPQMSAPIAPPNDFSQAFQASMASPTARTPMRDSFGGSGGPLGISQGSDHQRSGGYVDDISSSSMERKRSFTVSGPGSVPTSGAGTQHGYGTTA